MKEKPKYNSLTCVNLQRYKAFIIYNYYFKWLTNFAPIINESM